MPLSRRAALRSTTAALAALAAPDPVGAAERMAVVASFSIIADLVRVVGGDQVAVTTLVPIGAELHGFAPRPSEARAVASARLFVINGLGLETWAERLASAAGFRGVGVVASKGVMALPALQGHAGHGHAHGHGPRGAPDPHAWQDVANVRIYVGNIRDALIAADPASAGAFSSRAAAYLRDLDALDAEVRQIIGAIPRENRRVVTTHEAFRYYADAYDLDFLAPLGLTGDAEPSARAFAALIAQIRRERIRAAFLEQGLPSRLMDQLVQETGIRIGGTLYAETLTGPDGPAPSYVAMMRTNTRTIAAALA